MPNKSKINKMFTMNIIKMEGSINYVNNLFQLLFSENRSKIKDKTEIGKK